MFIEVRPGEGGDDAVAFARELLDVLAKAFGVRVQPNTEHGRTLIATIPDDVAHEIEPFVGTHRVQRIPANDPRGRRHTSTASIALVPETTSVEVALAGDDIEVQPYRASGKGGQNRNKRWTAVRARHIPSGLVVVCADERHFEANRRKALAELSRRLTEALASRTAEGVNAVRSVQVRSERSAKTFTHNQQRGEVRCHETGRTWRLRDWERGRL